MKLCGIHKLNNQCIMIYLPGFLLAMKMAILSKIRLLLLWSRTTKWSWSCIKPSKFFLRNFNDSLWSRRWKCSCVDSHRLTKRDGNLLHFNNIVSIYLRVNSCIVDSKACLASAWTFTALEYRRVKYRSTIWTKKELVTTLWNNEKKI